MNIQDLPLNVLERRSSYVIADFKEVFAYGFIEIIEIVVFSGSFSWSSNCQFRGKNAQVHLINTKEWPKNNHPILRNLDNFPSGAFYSNSPHPAPSLVKRT